MKSKIITAEQIYREKQLDYFDSIIDAIPEEIIIPLFSEWARDNRTIPAGVSDYDGPFKPEIVPHLMYILDLLHPDNPATHVYFMANAQSGKTVSILENAIGAIIRYMLGSILYVTSTQDSVKVRGAINIDTLIDNSGLADYVKPASGRRKNVTGDQGDFKQFAGGLKLRMTSYNTISAMKSDSYNYIFEDELDEAKAELKDQGDIEGILEGRTKGKAAGNYKIFGLSTPTRMETSRIYRNFLRGDQNKLHLPCPLCGEYQELILKPRGGEYGLTFRAEKDKGNGKKVVVPESIHYICQHCRGEFRESKKSWMLRNFKWIPQNPGAGDKIRTFHASGLSAPEIMLSWERICFDFADAGFGEDLLKFKDFTINDLGWPWAGVQKQAGWEKVKEKAEENCLGEVPKGHVVQIDGQEVYKGPLVLYSGCDVQGDRLELGVFGFGYDMEIWQVDKQIFYGNTAQLSSACYKQLHDWVYTHAYEICGKKRTIALCAIDAGYNNKKLERIKDFADKARIIYNFVGRRQDKFRAVKGQGHEKGSELFTPARVNDAKNPLKTVYNLYVSSIKEIIMNRITQAEDFGALHFPKYKKDPAGNKIERPDEDWKRLISERYQELEPKKYGWKKIHERNEDWDTLIYAYAAAEFDGVSSWPTVRWIMLWKSLVG